MSYDVSFVNLNSDQHSYFVFYGCYLDCVIVVWATGCIIYLASGKFKWNLRLVISELTSVVDSWGSSCKIALRWMSLDLTDDKSALVQVMAWCSQAGSYSITPPPPPPPPPTPTPPPPPPPPHHPPPTPPPPPPPTPTPHPPHPPPHPPPPTQKKKNAPDYCFCFIFFPD